jgi:hypothetical protein
MGARAGRHGSRRRLSPLPPLSKLKASSSFPSTPLRFPQLTRSPRHPGRRRRHLPCATAPCPCPARSPEEGEGCFAHDPL